MSESANAADKPHGAALPWVANLDGKPVCQYHGPKWALSGVVLSVTHTTRARAASGGLRPVTPHPTARASNAGWFTPRGRRGAGRARATQVASGDWRQLPVAAHSTFRLPPTNQVPDPTELQVGPDDPAGNGTSQP